MRFGTVLDEGGTTFRLWAPKSADVALMIEGGKEALPMQSTADGFHELSVPDAEPGTLYRFRLAGGEVIPDPLSRFQPQDVHGPSEVIDPAAYSWQSPEWRGRAWEEAVLYELHIGTFTREGTYAAAIAKLDRLTEIGITAIELMPVADFPGSRNWGYDGVQLFAPESSYGRPEDLKALIDAAHQRGLMVLHDVVYNHFGPDGNYLPACCPIYTEHHHTPWGPAVNFDTVGSEMVREIICENALYWIDEYNFDGLRLDAVHEIKDDSPKHILDELAERVHAATPDRHVHLILESDANIASRLRRDASGKAIHYVAQWNDDIHHMVHTSAADDLRDLYEEFVDDAAKLGRGLAEGFVFQGEWTKRKQRPRGEPSAFLPPSAFITFIQNHDQVGNRPFGERFADLAPREAARAVITLLLLSPQIPLIFMGEEWAASTPFLFFCDFGGEIGEAVRKGRQAEFGHHPDHRHPERSTRIPDPLALDTLNASKLDWNEIDKGKHGEWRDFYRRLLEVRHAEIVPRLKGMAGNAGSFAVLGPQAVHVRWRMSDGARLNLVMNLTAERLNVAAPALGRMLWAEGAYAESGLGPWTVAFGIDDAGPGG